MISIEPAPMLEDKEKWSLVFHDFVAKCLTKEPRLRPTAAEMLKHKFIEKCKSGASAMFPKIEKAKKIRASMATQSQSVAPSESGNIPAIGPKLNEDYGDTVPSRPLNIALQEETEAGSISTQEKQQISDNVEVAGEGYFGTVIVHGGDEADNTFTRTQSSSVKQFSHDAAHVESPSVFSFESKPVEPWIDSKTDVAANNCSVGELSPVGQTMNTSSPAIPVLPEQKLQVNNISRTQVEGDGGICSTKLKNETVSKKAFALQDKLWSIYAAGNTVPIPFLRATDISPIALLSDNVLGGIQQENSGTVAAEELFSIPTFYAEFLEVVIFTSYF
ncbi:serine/threonine-protein kinase dst1-like [Carica papaya]|uniref:serine/threonine-protein kinase dst1-like n=1 Tax=Carica papaya TaxID=3649 RepID=UPI000B8CFFE0|nr:serine/threonine-protein kinase dst1-like [Carica papaya]